MTFYINNNKKMISQLSYDLLNNIYSFLSFTDIIKIIKLNKYFNESYLTSLNIDNKFDYQKKYFSIEGDIRFNYNNEENEYNYDKNLFDLNLLLKQSNFLIKNNNNINILKCCKTYFFDNNFLQSFITNKLTELNLNYCYHINDFDLLFHLNPKVLIKLNLAKTQNINLQNINDFYNLIELNINNNKTIKSLELPNLIKLNCENSIIKYINCPKLIYLNAHKSINLINIIFNNNKCEELNLTYCHNLNQNFLNTFLNTNYLKKLSASIVNFNINRINEFYNLILLDINYNNTIESIELPNLIKLYCCQSHIKYIDCPKLKHLVITNNEIIEILNLPSLIYLEAYYCYNLLYLNIPKIESLYIDGNPIITEINFEYLNILNANHCKKLKYINCPKLTTLTIIANKNITIIDSPLLKVLNIAFTNVNKIYSYEIEELYIFNNTKIKVEEIKKLKKLLWIDTYPTYL